MSSNEFDYNKYARLRDRGDGYFLNDKALKCIEYPKHTMLDVFCQVDFCYYNEFIFNHVFPQTAEETYHAYQKGIAKYQETIDYVYNLLGDKKQEKEKLIAKLGMDDEEDNRVYGVKYQIRECGDKIEKYKNEIIKLYEKNIEIRKKQIKMLKTVTIETEKLIIEE